MNTEGLLRKFASLMSQPARADDGTVLAEMVDTWFDIVLTSLSTIALSMSLVGRQGPPFPPTLEALSVETDRLVRLRRRQRELEVSIKSSDTKRKTRRRSAR
jgi:hypothetical protein